ncbi:MAG: AAA family ATPase [Minwuiales bacterium]|nr:AAA family ATPase [Minwuiales bacterium]
MIISFDDVVLDDARRELFRAGELIPTEPKVFDVLLYLVENRNRVVSRDELLQACWRNVYVSDGTLSRCISRIRHAIRQSRTASKPILTLHGKGYRFVASVSESNDAEIAHDASDADDRIESVEAHVAGVSVLEETALRFVTVLDAAVGFGADGSALDVESQHARLRKFFGNCEQIACRYGCGVVRPTCAGAEICFGYPRTVDSSAEAAVRTALEFIEAAKELGLEMRIGIASGRAIVDSSDGTRNPAVTIVGIDSFQPGSLRAVAGPNQCIVDECTARLIENRFVVERQGEAVTMGRVVPVFSVSPTAPVSHVDDIPFIGRTSEIAFLEHCWRYSVDGLGQVIYLTGDAGMGKTRLVRELVKRVGVSKGALLRVQCSSYHRQTPLYPFHAMLQSLAPVDGGSTATERPSGGEGLPAQFGQQILDDTSEVEDLLRKLRSSTELASQGACHPDENEQVIDAFAAAILSVARRTPAILWVDDMQWADPLTLAVIDRVRSKTSNARILVILAGQSTEAAPIGQSNSATTIDLVPITQKTIISAFNEWTEGPAMSPRAIARLIARTDGVPLYLRDMVHMAQANPESLEETTIPESLWCQLQSRLDEAGPAKETIEWASLLGRAFTKQVLIVVSKIPEDELTAALDHLVAIGLLRLWQHGKCEGYRFTHGLVRDAAYGSMLARCRRARHRRVAESLISTFSQIALDDPHLATDLFKGADASGVAAPFRQAVKHVVETGLESSSEALAGYLSTHERASSPSAAVFEMLPVEAGRPAA